MPRLINRVMAGFSCLYAAGKLIRIWMEVAYGLPQGYDYEITTWLIDYRGGFVRRGLTGEALWWLHRWTGVDPLHVIVPLACCLFVFLIVSLAIAFHRKGWLWWLIPTTFLLGGIDVLRTDGLLLSLVWTAGLALFGIRRPAVRIFTVNAVLVLAVLVHEAAFFMSVPMFASCLWSDARLKMPGPLRLLLLLPVVVVFLAVVGHPGDGAARDAIVSGWRGTLGPVWENARFLGVSVGSSPADVVRAQVSCLTTVYFGIPAWTFVPAGVVFAGLYFCAISGTFAGLGVLRVQFLALTPVLAVLCDPSRAACFWLFGSCVWLLLGRSDRSLAPRAVSHGSIPSVVRRTILAASLFVGLPYVGYSPCTAVGQSPVGTCLTFVFGKLLVDRGCLLTPGYPLIEAWAR